MSNPFHSLLINRIVHGRLTKSIESQYRIPLFTPLGQNHKPIRSLWSTLKGCTIFTTLRGGKSFVLFLYWALDNSRRIGRTDTPVTWPFLHFEGPLFY